MKVYVETNFILELAFLQEQLDSCQNIVQLCSDERATLVLPMFCVAETYETLIRRKKERDRVAEVLGQQLRQVSRSLPYKAAIDALQDITALLVRSSEEEDQRLQRALDTLLRLTDLVPLTPTVVTDATRYRTAYDLEPQDALVLASVINHIVGEGVTQSCFLNRNNKDFDDSDIHDLLSTHGCKMLFSFEQGYNYIQYRGGA
ncbi:MAG: DUF4935 domain-containing protein [Anaerolineae bacterium]|nr:DUF4935 domain-containing protein [Anaerolineae bacterium]